MSAQHSVHPSPAARTNRSGKDWQSRRRRGLGDTASWLMFLSRLPWWEIVKFHRVHTLSAPAEVEPPSSRDGALSPTCVRSKPARSTLKFIDGQNIYLQCLCLRIQILYVTFVLKGGGPKFTLFSKERNVFAVSLKTYLPKSLKLILTTLTQICRQTFLMGEGYPPSSAYFGDFIILEVLCWL